MKQRYCNTVQEYICKGFAAVTPPPLTDNTPLWFLSPQPVLNLNNWDKVRVLFECVAQYKGLSLNNVLKQGPKLTDNQFGVITCIQKECTGNVAAMFYLV